MVSPAAFVAVSIGVHLVFVQQPPSPPSFLKGMTAIIGLNEQDWYDADEPYNVGHWACSMSKVSVTITPLLLNLVLTAAFSLMTYIDATILRWALREELNDGRPVFISNPRLFIALKKHAPLSWYANCLSGMALVLAFGATAVLTTEIDVIGTTAASRLPLDAKPFEGPRYGLDFSGWALLVIGGALFIQFVITSWNILWNPALVKTWSTNPLMVGRAASMFPRAERPKLEAQNAKCLSRRCDWSLLIGKRGETGALTNQSSETTLAQPDPPRNSQPTTAESINPVTHDTPISQPSLNATFKHVKHLKLSLWLLVALSTSAVATVFIIAARRDSNTRQFVYNSSLSTSTTSYWQWYGYLYFPYVANFNNGIIDDQRDWLGILIQSLVQAPVTLALHYTSLILDLNCDEATWGRVATKGVQAYTNPFLDVAVCWKAWLFFIVKGVLQWVFGYAVYSSQLVVSVSLIPLITLTALLLLLALIAEFMTRCRPKGTVPATWGNIDMLAQLVGHLDGEYFHWDFEKQKLCARARR
jgi:hypothetical protein